jgi:hypothetical protein
VVELRIPSNIGSGAEWDPITLRLTEALQGKSMIFEELTIDLNISDTDSQVIMEQARSLLHVVSDALVLAIN